MIHYRIGQKWVVSRREPIFIWIGNWHREKKEHGDNGGSPGIATELGLTLARYTGTEHTVCVSPDPNPGQLEEGRLCLARHLEGPRKAVLRGPPVAGTACSSGEQQKVARGLKTSQLCSAYTDTGNSISSVRDSPEHWAGP